MNPRRASLILALASALALALAGCTALKAHIMAAKARAGLDALTGYRGTVSERGLLPERPLEPLRRSIIYASPGRARAEVIAPQEHAGQLFIFDGAELKVWWPRYFVGLRVRGLSIPDKDARDAAILTNCRWAAERYDYFYEGPGRRAGREVVPWAAAPKDRQRYDELRLALDAEYAIPLDIQLRRPQEAWYHMSFEAIDFDAPIADADFAFDFPDGAIIYDWDLAAPGISLAEAAERVAFPLLTPAALPPGHRIRKVVASEHERSPMLALIMDAGGRWLSLTEMPDQGPMQLPELGVPIAIGEAEGMLNFAFGTTILSWAQDGVFLTLIGQLPYPELIALASSMQRWGGGRP